MTNGLRWLLACVIILFSLGTYFFYSMAEAATYYVYDINGLSGMVDWSDVPTQSEKIRAGEAPAPQCISVYEVRYLAHIDAPGVYRIADITPLEHALVCGSGNR